MANVNAPRGLVPVRKLGGGSITQNAYSIATDYTTAIYTGDVVEMTGTGKNVTKSASGNTDNVGVFIGCSYIDANGKPVWSKYWPGVSDGKTNIVAQVIDDPDVIWEVRPMDAWPLKLAWSRIGMWAPATPNPANPACMPWYLAPAPRRAAV